MSSSSSAGVSGVCRQLLLGAVVLLGFGLVGALGSFALAWVAIRFGYEYLFIVKKIAYDLILMQPAGSAAQLLPQGFRFGLFLGAFWLAMRVTGDGHLPKARAMVGQGCLVALSGIMGALVGGGLSLAYVRHGGTILPADLLVQIGNVYRVQTLVGMEYGMQAAALLAVGCLARRKCSTAGDRGI